MAYKRKQGGKVLEWVSDFVNGTAGATNIRSVVNLNLDDDELAEIHQIETEIAFVRTALATDDLEAQCMLSMDPSVSIADNPYEEAQYEDLETLYTHRVLQEVTVSDTAAAIDQNAMSNFQKCLQFQPYPLLIATNPGFLVSPDTGLVTQFHLRIWFTRRKAVGNELARTLLKRR